MEERHTKTSQHPSKALAYPKPRRHRADTGLAIKKQTLQHNKMLKEVVQYTLLSSQTTTTHRTGPATRKGSEPLSGSKRTTYTGTLLKCKVTGVSNIP